MTCSKISDTQIMQRIARGDSAAFNTLMDRYGSGIKNRLLQIVRNQTSAEDLFQEVFLRVWTRAEQWQGKGSLPGWLLRMATNLALNHLRSQRRAKTHTLELSQSTSDEEPGISPAWLVDEDTLQPDEILEKLEQSAVVNRVVDTLPSKQRQVIRMVHEAEMDIREVADQLHLPLGTVKSRLHYARIKLSLELEALE